MEQIAPVDPSNVSAKSRLVTLLFCILLGIFGVHRFYVGKIGTGILMLLTLGGLGIWNLIDLILVAVGSFRDKEGKRVFRWLEPGSM
jgi:TM2 domain-containing membrane protein YozV